MKDYRFLTAGIIAVMIFVAAVAFAIGQRTTCFNFLGLAHGCVVDTTKH